MCRKPRRESTTDYYHVIARGMNHEAVLNTRGERDYFLKLIHEQCQLYPIKIYGYCIMKDHIHFLINAKLDALSSFMAKVLANYAKYYNCKHERTGYVFQDRFLSECIETEERFWNCFRYIHKNSVQAELVKNPVRYKYSSLQDYYDENTHIVHRDAMDKVYGRFGSIREMLDYHKTVSLDLFCDTDEDRLTQCIELGKGEVQSMCMIHHIKPGKILSCVPYRNAYVESSRKQFGLSRKEAREILEQVVTYLGMD